MIWMFTVWDTIIIWKNWKRKKNIICILWLHNTFQLPLLSIQTLEPLVTICFNYFPLLIHGEIITDLLKQGWSLWPHRGPARTRQLGWQGEQPTKSWYVVVVHSYPAGEISQRCVWGGGNRIVPLQLSLLQCV